MRTTHMVLGALASCAATSAFTLSELEPLPMDEVSTSCTKAYNATINDCPDAQGFKSQEPCSNACLNNLLSYQKTVASSCADSFVSPYSLLQYILSGELTDALCPASVSSSSSSSSKPSATQTISASAAATPSAVSTTTFSASLTSSTPSTSSSDFSMALSGTLTASSYSIDTAAPSFSGIMTLSTSIVQQSMPSDILYDTSSTLANAGITLDDSPTPSVSRIGISSVPTSASAGGLLLDNSHPSAGASTTSFVFVSGAPTAATDLSGSAATFAAASASPSASSNGSSIETTQGNSGDRVTTSGSLLGAVMAVFVAVWML